MALLGGEVQYVQVFARVNTYDDLPPAGNALNRYYDVINSQGSQYIPGWLGGADFYPKGIYFSDGMNWDYRGVFPYQATLAQVNAGVDNDKFVTSSTLSNSNWAFTAAKVLGTLLAGLNTSLTGDITASDSILTAFGRLQNSVSTNTTNIATNTTAIAGKEPTITGSGNTTDFWSGTKTWRDLATDVRAVVLTGLSLVTSSPITSADTILSALGKLQAQITNNTRPIAEWYSDGSQVSPTDASVYYFGNINNGTLATANTFRIVSPKNNAIFYVSWNDNIAGTLGSAEGGTIEILNLTQATSETLTTSHPNTARISSSHLISTLANNIGDEITVRKTNPSWGTNPTVVSTSITVKAH